MEVKNEKEKKGREITVVTVPTATIATAGTTMKRRYCGDVQFVIQDC